MPSVTKLVYSLDELNVLYLIGHHWCDLCVLCLQWHYDVKWAFYHHLLLSPVTLFL